jgi:hypothetical protein
VVGAGATNVAVLAKSLWYENVLGNQWGSGHIQLNRHFRVRVLPPQPCSRSPRCDSCRNKLHIAREPSTHFIGWTLRSEPNDSQGATSISDESQLRRSGLGFVADEMCSAIGRSYGVNIEAHPFRSMAPMLPPSMTPTTPRPREHASSNRICVTRRPVGTSITAARSAALVPPRQHGGADVDGRTGSVG